MSRTPEQIANARAVFAMMLGPFGMMMDDSMVDSILTKIQRESWINDHTKYKWSIQVRLYEDGDEKNWDEVDPNPREVIIDFATLLESSYKLLLKYPRIKDIKVTRIGDNGSFWSDIITSEWAFSTYLLLGETNYYESGNSILA